MLIANSVLELIGRTPLLRLHRLSGPEAATILAKLEARNPGGSIKDRIALAMVEEAEAKGWLSPGGSIVEATAGNTGVALAIVAAAKGYRLVVAMPETVSQEHRRLLSRYGAEVMLTPGAQGMAGAVRAAQELAARTSGSFLPRAFENPANPEAHRKGTAQEIVEATGGKLDAFVAGIGTGGTITGVGEVLKRVAPLVKVIGVEPARSPVLSQGRAGRHGIPGLGAGFVPKVLNREILDEVIPVEDEEALEMMGRLAREEGLLVGVSAGANIWASLKVGRRLGPGKVVVTVLPDSGERYSNLP